MKYESYIFDLDGTLLTLSTTLRQAATSPFALMACLSIALTTFAGLWATGCVCS